MKAFVPSRVLITGGREIGGVASFAEALRAGFSELGIYAEVIPPGRIITRWKDLRDPEILKILSTTAVFAAPFARRAICMAHGFPCIAHVGLRRAMAILASLRMATVSRGAQLVAVSDYSALELRVVFGLRVDAVIRNPLHPLFLEPRPDVEPARKAITYAGRLVAAKNLHILLPAILDVLDENPGLEAWIAGEGPLRPRLEEIARGDPRVNFLGVVPPREVRDRLRRSCVFISGSPTEPFGIVYLEALSQGCAVVMPASGGGLEIAPDEIGGRIQLFPASLGRTEIAAAIRRALEIDPQAMKMPAYDARAVARNYLTIAARFTRDGLFHGYRDPLQQGISRARSAAASAGQFEAVSNAEGHQG